MHEVPSKALLRVSRTAAELARDDLCILKESAEKRPKLDFPGKPMARYARQSGFFDYDADS